MAESTAKVPVHEFAGTNKARQEVGLPGHCDRCCEVGHVAAHRGLGCGDVGCDKAHGPDEEHAARLRRIFQEAGIGKAAKVPTRRQVESALDTLLWLWDETDSGDTRDEISRVRGLLTDVLDRRGSR